MRKLLPLCVVLACSDPVTIGRGTLYEQVLTNDMDLLFMVDNSASMTPIQQNLAANFPGFVEVLDQLPGGLPDVHLAVVTSSLGAGVFTTAVPGCSQSDHGNFVFQARQGGSACAER
jgi:hypothetical protein